jgi:hypothetical protein
VLDEVAAQDYVERPVLERELHRLDVGDEDVLTHRAGHLGSGGIALDPDDDAAAVDERPGEVAARAADVEHTLPRAHELEEASMTAERSQVELDVAGGVLRRHATRRRCHPKTPV